MKERIPLAISEDRLVLIAVIEGKPLRTGRQMVEFVIDTGSPNSYLSTMEVKKSQISLDGRQATGTVNFGGSTFEQFSLPPLDMYLLKEGKKDEHMILKISLKALKTTKLS